MCAVITALRDDHVLTSFLQFSVRKHLWTHFVGTESYAQSFEPGLGCNNLKKANPCLTGSTLRRNHKDQPLNAVWRNGLCFFFCLRKHETDKFALWAKLEFFKAKPDGIYIYHYALNV